MAVLTPASLCAQAWLDRVDDALCLGTAEGRARVEFSALVDLEGYVFDAPPPELIFEDQNFVNPRLSLFGEARFGRQWYAYTQFRFDRGFDPGSANHEARFDEYWLRYTPWASGALNLQAGKFATVFGNWVKRHDSWNNPFVDAPMLYSEITTVSDQTIVPNPPAFLARRALPENKPKWQTTIWGPSYTTGGSVFGSIDRFDYALEVKNAALSARPQSWDAFNRGFDDPTITGRLGWRPSAEWNLGLSGSGGSYLQDNANVPPGSGTGDFRQYAAGLDLGWARHRWQSWAEFVVSRFEVPNVGDADLFGFYLETKYKINAHLFAAARWNMLFFGDVGDGRGRELAWDNDGWRFDLALGWRFNRHWQLKVQYNHGEQSDPSVQGNDLFAGQLTLRF